MEELCEYHVYAVENNIDTQFKFNEFNSISVMIKFLTEEGVEGLPNKMVVDILNEYAKETGYIIVRGDMVRLTEKGIAKCKKPHHDWG